MTPIDLDLRLRHYDGHWSFECRSLELVATAAGLAATSAQLLDLAQTEAVPLAAVEAHLKAESARRLARLRLLLEVLGPLCRQSEECSICRSRHGSEVRHACE